MNEFKTPEVGSVINVTTIFGSYTGKVVPNERFDPPASFCMTGDKIMPIRNIMLKNVKVLEFVSGSFIQEKVRAWRVKSADKNREYTVTLVGKKLSCTCTGFTFRHKCKHTDSVKTKYKV